MSLLAPLYALGALAIGLPILFHLIRRTPRGRTIFSSLMFLAPSPPRITRRSRLEHLLLLLLRATALILLALAFARPFFRESAQLGFLHKHDRRIALLVDISASMQRDDIWQQVLWQSNDVLKSVQSGDDVALFVFDDHLQTLVDFDNEPAADVQARLESIRYELKQLRPGWGASRIGEALAGLADQMDADADRSQSDAVLQIHLLTDFQEGSRLEALQNHQWPTRVHVDVHVLENGTGNAGLQEIVELDDLRSGAWRVRVSNDSLAKQETFRLHWLDERGKELSTPAATALYVPAGQDRAVRLTPPDGKTVGGLQLDDRYDFDNTLYLATPSPRKIRVVYAGTDASDDVRGMRYYLQQALLADPRRTVEYSSVSPADLSATLLRDHDLLVLAGAPTPSALEAIQQFAAAGGWVVAALCSAEQSTSLTKLFGSEQVHVREAAVSGYAMLAEIDFQHPLFARLNDARYSDFTKIRFWKMRELVLPERQDDLQVVARFDNQMPAIVQRVIGEGGLWVLASTWSPDDSQLALSTKFIPLVAGWLQAASPLPDEPPRRIVGQPLALQSPFNLSQSVELQTPDGKRQQLEISSLNEQTLSQPGQYLAEQGDLRQTFAVNISPHESRTTPLDPSVLEQFGVRLGNAVRHGDDVQRQRQLRDQELEKRQQVWRWLIAAALATLAAETWIAAYTTRRLARQNAGTMSSAHSLGNVHM